MTDILEEIKDELNITWNDDNTNIRLINMIKRAEYKINDYAGTTVNISQDLEARDLVINLVRYMWNNTSDLFESNYKPDILMLHAKYHVAAMKDETEATEI